MKKWFGVVLMLWFTLPIHAGDSVGNGGGVAEHYVTFAYLNLERYITLCLSTEACRVTPEEQVILRNIRGAMAKERLNASQLGFKSEAKEPGFFLIDGQVRVAKTGDDVGSPVYVNVDLLYSKNTSQETVSIPFTSAVAILIHEMGHHHGQKNHLTLDLLGAKVATLMKAQTQEMSVNPFESNVVVTAINFQKAMGNFTQLLVSDGLHTVDYSAQVRQMVSCPSGGQLAYLLIWNVHWMRESFDQTASGPTFRIPLRGQLNLQCISRSGARFVQDQDLKVDLAFERDSAWKLRLVSDSERISQIDCTQKPNDCH